MHVSSWGRIALRHWPLTIVALALTATGLFAVAWTAQPIYQSSASVVLIPPQSTLDPNSNRYLALGSLDQAVGVVTRSLISDEVRAKVGKTGPGTYDVTADWTTSAPILVVTVKASSVTEANALLTAATAQIPEVLTQLQTSIGVQNSQAITSLPLTRDKAPQRLYKPLIRELVVVGGFLFALSFGAIVALDALMMRRSRRPAAAAAATGQGPLPTDESVAPGVPVAGPPRADDPEDAPVPAAKVADRGERPALPTRTPRQHPRPAVTTLRSAERADADSDADGQKLAAG